MASQEKPLPTLHSGIIGLITSWFTKDITLARNFPSATHKIQAIGSSSLQKGIAFVNAHLPSSNLKPTIYAKYNGVYNDPEVDIVYIGTPHSLHKRHCLDAIAGGKHVLCEKAFTLNAAEARKVFAAAQAKGVFIMEAMWTRFRPLILELRHVLFEEKAIGDVRRTFCDFGLEIDIASLPATSRQHTNERPKVTTVQTLRDGIDVASSFLLHYPSTGRHGILFCTTEARTPEVFARIKGTEGYITVQGVAASSPRAFTVYRKRKAGSSSTGEDGSSEGERHELELEGMGF
ncbi:hypothetical protein BDW74DRAFT_178371 [Aspergillus multicolor]|uniref:Gfo/Idh/MocA family protein n=1 Tax=Aspergillus multicolor TaxID=41759 RepID=UPI003CCD99A3